jgi:sec-independent protein translocase protein TatA
MFRNPTTDLIVVLVIVLLVLGPKRLPGLGKGLGQGMREFKDSIGGRHKDEEDEEKPAIAPPTASASDPVTANRSEPTPTSGTGSEVGSERRS